MRHFVPFMFGCASRSIGVLPSGKLRLLSIGSAVRSAIAAASLAILGSTLVATTAYAQSSPSAHTSATRYDILSRVTGTIAPDPDGSGALKYLATRTTYDARGNVTKVETGELASWQSESVAPASWSGFTVHTAAHSAYDSLNRKTKSWLVGSNNVTASMTQYSYDSVGRPECTAVRMNPATYNSLPASACTHATQGPDGKDRITKTVYDAAGQVLQVRRGVGTTLEQAEVTYSYRPNGQQEYVIDANGNRAKMHYDGHDRQNYWLFPSKTQPSNYNDATQATAIATAGGVNGADREYYSYDQNGNRIWHYKRDNRRVRHYYDALNRPYQKRYWSSATSYTDYVNYSYDNRGLQTSAISASAPTTGQGITTVYDDAGRVLTSSNNMGGTARTLSYQYDKNGNRTRITHPDGQYFTYTYDGLNRHYDIRENGGTRTTANRYNNLGQHKYNWIISGLHQYYYYEPAGRLNRLRTFVAGKAEDNYFDFSYTPASQIKSRTTSNDLYANTAHYDVQRNYTTNGLNQYTAAGPASFTYDANGNLTSDGSTTFTYDTENRLISASGAKNANLIYDPLGRLYEVNQGTAATTTRFLYDGDALVAEYDSAGAITHRYVHGNGVDNPLVWYDGSAVNSTTRHHLFANWQGSISAITDSAGNAIGVNGYDAYGIANDTNIGRFQYTGQIAIPEIGIYHYKARAYSPTLGRFLQTDPIGYDDGFNLYAYVGNDPTNKIDPTGMFEKGDTLTPIFSQYRLSIVSPEEGGKSRAESRVNAVNGPSDDPPAAEGSFAETLEAINEALESFNDVFIGELREAVANPSVESAGNVIIGQATKPLKALKPLKPSKVTVKFRTRPSVSKPKTGRAQTIQRGRAATRREAEALNSANKPGSRYEILNNIRRILEDLGF